MTEPGSGFWVLGSGFGTTHARANRMIVRRYQDLECWRLANQVKREVYAVIARPEVVRDFKFCDQIRESARSAPRNIAEGFGRFRPAENARFCEFAKGSLLETDNHMLDALDQQYVTKDEWKNLSLLIDRGHYEVHRLPEGNRPVPLNAASASSNAAPAIRTKNQELRTRNSERVHQLYILHRLCIHSQSSGFRLTYISRTSVQR
jgi:four helix bundle protein